MAHVYVCTEKSEYEYENIEGVYANKEDALKWLETIDAGEHGKETMYEVKFTAM